MDLDDIPKGSRTEYYETCKLCDKKHKVLTQCANNQEYDTYIYIECDCGEYIEFILPVN